MSKRGLILFAALLILLFAVPLASAQDNATDVCNDTLESKAVSLDIYFDSNASDDLGDGSVDNPYKELKDGRILDNSRIHLKSGEYTITKFNTHTNISIMGEDALNTVVRGTGSVMVVNSRLLLTNVTICNLNIYNQGDLIASNTIFTNSSSAAGQKSFGGAIYCINPANNAYLTNCTFLNNRAGCGGAIYLNGGILEATDCAFINNTASNYGGAIACESKYSTRNNKLTIKRSKFINDVSIGDAGGAIYLRYGKLIGEDVNISSCEATFGGALTLLSSQITLTNLYAFNNTARYDGGAIYQFYGNLTLNNSVISFNHAKNGGGMLVDNASMIIVDNVTFENNTAELLAGAFYSLMNGKYEFNNLTYINNTAGGYDDLLKQDVMSAIIISGNYTLYNHEITDSSLPKYYSSRDRGYVTPVKDQKNGGNCWAFAAIATLESAILKASGESLDLSEENMKNLASLYSYYGWSMDPNEGGYDDMGFGYLTGWFGPVLEGDDVYCDYSLISPLMDGIMHVQNMIFLKRNDANDNDAIKRAIMNYGAVYSPIFMSAHYDSSTGKYVQYYRGNLPCDHAIAIVGWDDDFVISDAPGKGAWIAKNSWGPSWGNGGYFYISYYDRSCPKIGDDRGAIAFVFNDTMQYDKNYQYDVSKTDYFLNKTGTVWYRNIFNATDNEYLCAVSTFFEKNTNWELTVTVNDVVKASKSGYTLAGYYTFNLDEFIPLSVGDTFEVMFKITVDGDEVGVPISEVVSLNNLFYRENISFISYDGVNWKDLFNLTWEYPDHTYNSSVACIKAFTIINPINTTLTLEIENRTKSSAVLVAKVTNQWGYPMAGNVTFRIGEETYSVKLENGIARKQIVLVNASLYAEFSAVGYNTSNVSLALHDPLIATTISLNVSGQYNPVNITACIKDSNGNPARFGQVTFEVDGKKYTVRVSNGTATIEDISILPLELDISAIYNDGFYYDTSFATKHVEMLRINTNITLNITSPNEANNPVRVNVTVTDLNGNPVKSGYVTINMSGEEYQVKIVDGMACIDHTFEKTGNHSVNVTFNDDYLYNSSMANVSLTVSKIKFNLTVYYVIEETTAVLGVDFRNATKEFKAIFYVNDKNYTVTSKNGYAICMIDDLDYGTYNYTVVFISEIYEADDFHGEFNITVHKTDIIATDAKLYYNGDYTVMLKDKSGNPVSNREIFISLNGERYKKRTDDDGVAVFNFEVADGEHYAFISFLGDEEYCESKLTTTITFTSTVEFASYIYACNSKYVATLRDSTGKPLSNVKVTLVLNGVSHELYTDANGQISCSINLNPGTYSAKITNPVSGEVKTQNFEIVKRITENKGFKMYYGAGKSYKVRVCDDFGDFKKGLKVKFTVKGKTYYSNTNKNGYASFKITLKPGTYTITAEYNGYRVSNKITVKSTIITKDIKVKKGKAIKFKAKLVNKKGKALKNKKITFKFKGKTYKVKTNKKGKATLKITKKYKKGKYTITSKYGSLKIKNKIRIV